MFLNREYSTDDKDSHDLDSRHEVPRAPVDAHQPSHLDPEVREGVVFFVKALDLIHFPSECAHHTHTGEILLNLGGEFAFRLICQQETSGNSRVEECRVTHDQRNKEQYNQGQAQIHRKHDCEIEHDQKYDADNLHELRTDKVSDNLNVVRAALNNISCLMLYMPGIGKPLNVPV